MTDPREILASSKMSAIQIAAVAITIGLNALDGFDVLAISFASPGIAREWGIDRAALGFVLSMELIGMGLGSILLGGVADRVGRRRTLLGCLVVMTSGMIMATRAKGVYDLSVWRGFTRRRARGAFGAKQTAASGVFIAPPRGPQGFFLGLPHPLRAGLGGATPPPR